MAVVDVLYQQSASSAFDDEEAEVEDLPPDDEDKDDEDAQAEENFVLERNPVDAVLPDLTSTYKSLIDTVRTIVKLFRHEKYMKLDGFCINRFLPLPWKCLFEPWIRNIFFPDLRFQTHISESLTTIFWVKSSIILCKLQGCRSGMFILDHSFFHPGSEFLSRILDPHQRI